MALNFEADEIREDYLKIFTNPEVIKIVMDFKVSSDRLDDLFVDIAKAVPVSYALSEFILVILLLFHGNADVERGFSVNTHRISENLKEETVIARRVISETVQRAGGVSKVPLTNKVLTACREASKVYKAKLKQQEEENKDKQDSASQKRRICVLFIYHTANVVKWDKDHSLKKVLLCK